QVLHVDAAFGFATGATGGRLLDPALAGGAILDVGCYPVSMARAVVAAARGTAVADPVAVTGGGTLEGGVDAWAVGRLDFGDVTATVRTGVRLAESGVVVHGTRGSIRVQDPWTIGAEQSLTITVVGQEPVVERFEGEASYALEADGLAAAVGTGDSRIMSQADSLGNARVLDQWRAALGLVYPFETDDAPFPAPLVAPLQRGVDVDGKPGPMRHGRIPGVDKDVSRLVMGCDNQQTPAHAAAMFDSFFAAGGTTFDTAWLYGGGRQEALLGRWVRERGVRDEVVIITKGAHSPHCDPESISRQLLESLERQGTEHADIYLMHRDNPEVPVGEFVDVLDEHAKAGRIGVFGGSNWTPARFDEANAYAEANGRQGFTVLSNHFGLAEALDVPWKGCEHATDRASKQWLAERKVTLLPWSSQARGFFTGRAHPDDHSDPELVRCYYSEDNFERLRRAESLAAELGVPTTAVALAFVLHQEFPTFALIGPRSIAETRSSMAALDVELTPEQLAWLDLL
ncbi:aldo/keto reductase, partial [Desertihabitans aurantiacus]|uniref:aldo/keto reductase n=1 Tax=Desertihabitans aurantiacus TaxID=2282477 RepID=UPI000DF85DA2